METQTTVTVAQPIGPTGTPFAGFWIRVAAYLLDTAILFVPNFILMLIAGLLQAGPIFTLVQIAMFAAYYGYFGGGKWQATPGKRIVGIYVVRTNGELLGCGRAVGRYFAYIPSALIFLIGFIMVAFTRDKTGLHDLICDTRVIYGKR